jgi:hypothetical protein
MHEQELTSANLTSTAGRRSTREPDREMPAVIACRQHVCSSGKLLPVGDSAREDHPHRHNAVYAFVEQRDNSRLQGIPSARFVLARTRGRGGGKL